MDDQNNAVAVRTFAEAFAAAISAAVTQASGSPWQLEKADGQESPSRDAQPLQFKVQLDGGLSGESYVEFYEPQYSELLTKLSPAKKNKKKVASNPGEALSAVLSAATANLNSALSPQYGELTFKVESVSSLAFGGMYAAPFRVQADQPPIPSVFLYLDNSLLQALSPAAEGAEQAEAKGPVHPANLRLVMDVELNVSLRFGQRQLPLREVLELSSGSVIELDRMVDEPVEMLLDGKVVARGEAVIVDGNYGLRVTEIPQSVESHILRS